MSETFDNKVNSIESSRLADNSNAKDTRQHFMDELASVPPALSKNGITALSQSELLQHVTEKNTLGSAVPDTLLGRASVLGEAAAGSFKIGVTNSFFGVDHVSIPLSEKLLGKGMTVPVPAIVENAAAGAAIGFAARTLLPQTGLLGKVGSAVLGGVFLAPLASNGYKIFNDAKFANNMKDLQFAGQELGETLGSLAAGLPVGIAGYKFGDSLGAKFLATETMVPFAKAKGEFYDAMNQKLAAGINATAEGLRNALGAKPLPIKEAPTPAPDLKQNNIALAPADRTTADKAPADKAPEVNQAGELRSDVADIQTALYNQFKPALEVYHTGGRSNGGGVDGIQLPPLVSEADLQPFIEKLSKYLAAEDGIDVKEPAAGQSPDDFRTQVQHDAADAVLAHRQLYVSTALEMIKNPIISEMIQEALKQAPPEFFTAPSSSSGKYHPANEVNKGGLLLHSLRDVKMGAKLVDFYNEDASVNIVGNQNIAGDHQDLILGSLLVHDIEKGGTPWDKYDPAHGPEGATFLDGVWKDTPHQDFAQKMQELVNNHMAQWNKAPGNFSDPKPPKDIPNQIVSYADYLGSQPHVFVQPFPGLDQ